LLLKQKSPTPTSLTLLREGEAKVGEPISLAEFGSTNLWLELDLKPTLLGRLRKVLYRPSTVRLAALKNLEGKLLLRHRAPPVMMAAGFVASPLISRNEDLVDFYKGDEVARPAGYSVHVLEGDECFWQPTLRYRIYKMEKGLVAPGQ
jgi:hypothetical protein